MGIKSFNISNDVYEKYSARCKRLGISMSKQIENFMRSQIEEDPEVREEYLARLEEIRKGTFVKVDSLARRYGLDEP